MATYVALADAARAFLGEATAAISTSPSWLEAFGVITAFVASTVGLLAVVVKSVKLIRGVGHFLDDWNGEEVRSGFDGRLGVLARLAGVEKRTDQLTPNTNLIDAVARMEAQLNRSGMPAALDRIGRRLDRIEQHLGLAVDEHANDPWDPHPGSSPPA